MKDGPRTLANKETVIQRLGMLELSHVKLLTDFVNELRAEGIGDVPYFDPMDGGINATSLFLLEKPGRKAVLSGFISRNNNDQTAHNTFNFMVQAKIDRRTTCLWNTVPGWNGTRKITAIELEHGVSFLHRLIALLPNLAVVVLVGLKAQKVAPMLSDGGLTVLKSFHPSPINYATSPQKWSSIPNEWMKIHAVLERQSVPGLQ